jgi:hypothetical protein
MTLRAQRRPDSPSSCVRICRAVAKLCLFRHPRCPGPNGAPAPTGPAGGPPPPPPVSDEASCDAELEAAPDELDDDPLEEVPATAVWEAVVEFASAGRVTRARVTRRRDRTTWAAARRGCREAARLGRALPPTTIAGAMAAGLSPAGARAAYGARRPAGPTEPMIDAAARSVAAVAPATASARRLRIGNGGTRIAGIEIRGRRTLDGRSRSRGGLSLGSRTLRAGRATTSGAGASGACIASWMSADCSPQNASAPIGGGVGSAGRDASREALGPNGTSSSGGPNQSLGKWTTFARGSSSSPPASVCGPSLSTVSRPFIGGPQRTRLPSRVVYPSNGTSLSQLDENGS